MSAFSRGFFLRPRYHLPPPKSFSLQFLTTSRQQLLRSFTTSQLLLHAAQKVRPLPSKFPNGPLKKPLPQNPTYQSFADSLASKSHSTLLYAAPPHTLYIISSYTAAFFCFAYAGYNFHAHYMHPPANLSPWIPVAFGVVCFGMACFGGYLVLGPARLIKTITAIPPGQAQALAKGVGKNGNGPGLAIEIELRKMLPIPFFPARRVIARPEDLTLNRRIYVPPVDTRQSAVERLEERRRLEREEQEERRKSIWWRPFRDANRAFHKLFRAMRLVWTRDSFLELAVKGSKYKLDVGGGWGLDEGRALDRLVRLKALN
jgi:hypothetical protein